MSHRFFGFFSGFPSHHFPPEIVKRLDRELESRGMLVFVSAWPADYERNDSDSAGMNCMFTECNIPFAQYHVIDNRTEAALARQLLCEASCVFLMGGYPRLQIQLIREKGLDGVIRSTGAPVLGVSAGAINMARRSLDTKESVVPYDGLGLADITVKPHFMLDNRQVLTTLQQISAELPICAMEDDSAIFVSGGSITYSGQIYWVDKGNICPLSQSGLLTQL